MSTEWYYSRDGRQYGPLAWEQLHELASSGQLHSTDYVWTAGMADWQLAATVKDLFPHAPPPPPHYDSSKRIAAGVLGILLGALGVHKFVLGNTSGGLIMLLITLCTCFAGATVTGVIGMVEGIIYLTLSDEEFHQRYIVEGKSWF